MERTQRMLTFDLRLKVQEFQVVDTEGRNRTFKLKALTGDQRASFLNDMNRRIKMSPSGNPIGMTDFRGMQESLLGMCVYDDSDQLVPIDQLKTWPASVLGDLYDIAQELSSLNLGEGGLEKNG